MRPTRQGERGSEARHVKLKRLPGMRISDRSRRDGLSGPAENHTLNFMLMMSPSRTPYPRCSCRSRGTTPVPVAHADRVSIRRHDRGIIAKSCRVAHLAGGWSEKIALVRLDSKALKVPKIDIPHLRMLVIGRVQEGIKGARDRVIADWAHFGRLSRRRFIWLSKSGRGVRRGTELF